MLKSHFKGTGLQFKEHQVYVPGDDVRFIDWKILAKTSNPYVKTFDEERNVEIVVVLDISATMFFGDRGVTKLQAAIELCCLLYLLAKETNDYVHVLVVGNELVDIPKKSGDFGIIALISTLQEMGVLDSQGKVDHRYQDQIADTDDESKKYKSIMKHVGKKRELVILSDFNGLLSTEHLRRLLFRKNVHCFQILSLVDRSDSFPYMIKAVQSENSKKGMYQINFKKKDMNETLGKRIKQLNVEDRYLEDFIKEMM
ncbi:DUF58 domain-containing protein [Halobacteriovorax sp. GB3]|uniref:DUF58 domain-containing protein n=1 Tax=Halobacteriovorax sp. GB3 TaxID=2719615 RepID=UPI00235E4C9E|nr:DUF58 domain-containing protein [Halobacteriovorax sp. GB3]MDD0854617.1 DUF58 domain-containing protein [Halobacteriovorax sp. GB3]